MNVAGGRGEQYKAYKQGAEFWLGHTTKLRLVWYYKQSRKEVQSKEIVEYARRSDICDPLFSLPYRDTVSDSVWALSLERVS
jgi:hypothetical protein